MPEASLPATIRLQKADAFEKKLRGVMQLLGPEAQDKKLQHIDERLKGRESLGGFTADTMQLMLQRMSKEFSLSTFPRPGITNECNEPSGASDTTPMK